MPSVKSLKEEIKAIKDKGVKCKGISKMNKTQLMGYLEELQKENVITDIVEGKYDLEDAKSITDLKKEIKKVKKIKIKKVKKVKKVKKIKIKKVKKPLKKEMDKLESIEQSKPIEKKFIKNIKGFVKINPEVVKRFTEKKRKQRERRVFKGSRPDDDKEAEEKNKKFDSYFIDVGDEIFSINTEQADMLYNIMFKKKIENLNDKLKKAKTKTQKKLITNDLKKMSKQIKKLVA